MTENRKQQFEEPKQQLKRTEFRFLVMPGRGSLDLNCKTCGEFDLRRLDKLDTKDRTKHYRSSDA